MPQSIVARKGSVGIMVQELVKNFRMIMAPNTASHLTERRLLLMGSITFLGRTV